MGAVCRRGGGPVRDGARPGHPRPQHLPRVPPRQPPAADADLVCGVAAAVSAHEPVVRQVVGGAQGVGRHPEPRARRDHAVRRVLPRGPAAAAPGVRAVDHRVHARAARAPAGQRGREGAPARRAERVRDGDAAQQPAPRRQVAVGARRGHQAGAHEPSAAADDDDQRAVLLRRAGHVRAHLPHAHAASVHAPHLALPHDLAHHAALRPVDPVPLGHHPHLPAGGLAAAGHRRDRGADRGAVRCAAAGRHLHARGAGRAPGAQRVRPGIRVRRDLGDRRAEAQQRAERRQAAMGGGHQGWCQPVMWSALV
mmetsp:Transcript_33739/g.85395  ORF Transcript_33739/g.85395 Transcript_33739/m.85395 type:complete len:310 (+) Transcript_33739:300-1229(+)